jgi:2-methylcitrate dehydratase PrpD
MPSALESLAALIQDPALDSHAAARIERLRLHIADTIAMMLQGASLDEGKTAIAIGPRLASHCACARLTEADDIHLTSCTTPGSVVVPTALHLASAGCFKTFGEFVTAVFAGYETLIRVGYAIDGPRILAKKIWPTLFAAPAGAAAVACRAWKLSASQTAGALSTALAASTGFAPPAMTPNSSRWIALGFAAEYGVEAAMAAKHGAVGDLQLRIPARRLIQGLGSRFFFDEVGLKPYPIARQGLAAVEACRQLAGTNTKGITAITVYVSSAQRRIIDRPAPSNRMQSIASAQYQIAAALKSFAGKISIRTDARLDAEYPETWPARVVVQQSGKRKTLFLATPRGDFRNPMDWEDVLRKATPYGMTLSRIRTTDMQEPLPLDILPDEISIYL